MRLSLDTLFLLALMGDEIAEGVLLWLCGAHPSQCAKPWWVSQNRDAEAWSVNGGNIGAGWPGISDARRWVIRLQGRN